MVSLGPSVLHALAQIRNIVRTGEPRQLGILYHALLGLAGDALVGAVDLGQLAELSQSSDPGHTPGTKVPDLWISPKDAALRLGHSERWLRRRRLKEPYCSFCIEGDSGRGYRVSQAKLEEFMQKASARK
jgi:hypothetical protein